MASPMVMLTMENGNRIFGKSRWWYISLHTSMLHVNVWNISTSIMWLLGWLLITSPYMKHIHRMTRGGTFLLPGTLSIRLGKHTYSGLKNKTHRPYSIYTTWFMMIFLVRKNVFPTYVVKIRWGFLTAIWFNFDLALLQGRPHPVPFFFSPC